MLLCFLAVLPQFVGDAGATRWQLAMLGAVNVTTEVVLHGAVGVLAGTVHSRTAHPGAASPRASSVVSHLAAAVYVILAAVVLVEVLVG